MNEQLIISMAEPYVKDGSITYDQFENIYSFLSLKEKYEITDILYRNSIDLVDKEEQIDNDTFVLEADLEETEIDEYVEESDDEFSILYDSGLFKDSNYDTEVPESLVINRNVKQSNEILCTLIQQGNLQAAQDLCVKNHRLVAKYALAYTKKFKHHLDFEDLQQVGFMGLLRAAQKFDIKMGFSFSTYAVWWIKQAITREIMDSGYTIRIPKHMMERINRVNAASSKYIDCTYKEKIQNIAEELDMTEEQVRECIILQNNYLTCPSLNTPVGDDMENELGDLVSAEDELSVEDIVAAKDLSRCLDEELSLFSEREQQVLRMRYGFDDGIPRTLEYVGQHLGVTRERIRQIEERAIRRFKLHSRMKKLEDFI